MTADAQEMIEICTRLGDKEMILQYKGEIGDYVELDDDYNFYSDFSTSLSFDIGKINKALKEYWEDIGF